MARSAIAGVKSSSRKLDSQINKELKKIEKKKELEKAKSERDAKKKKLDSLRKKR
ncbi:hypothetical protein Q5H93_02950 [Hymenobacter sp. ASUV-10]|uniref:Uncharacterized protein n=1 Tax=Hymenobacter aranciens TaxID=3063996 RepID=A0ABT9B698_9BACT|nr:hypothetical protein [Hymenobacter sp. ASUV-10]MDO7873677.1 hypothetical protein [Hymenobacter sp. ASUV-10]